MSAGAGWAAGGAAGGALGAAGAAGAASSADSAKLDNLVAGLASLKGVVDAMDIAIMAKLNAAEDLKVGQKTKFTSDHRRVLTILAKRHYKRAEGFINAAASTAFPSNEK